MATSNTSLSVEPIDAPCGAEVRGIDLAHAIDAPTLRDIRKAWIDHKVLVFPDQHLSDDALVNFTNALGGVGDDPFFLPISDHTPVVALTRRADEKAPVFAQAWHTDWSFKETPPAGTCLYSLKIPPVGGNTDFLNQQLALEKMPEALRKRIAGKRGFHSARVAYAPDGTYGRQEDGSDRSMKIVYSDDARKVQTHDLIRRHPESGADTLFGCYGYIFGIEGMPEEEARELLLELYHWQCSAEFQYSHHWQENMLVLWDNRCVLHRANGGYDGYERELHRTTVKDNPARYLDRRSP